MPPASLLRTLGAVRLVFICPPACLHGVMTEQPPAAVTEDLDRLETALDAAFPARTASNLLVGTWNIRALGHLTAKCLAGPKDSPKRDWHAIACLAAVIFRFDVAAIQESRRNPAALKRLLARLGPHWQVIISHVTEGRATVNASSTTAPAPSPRAWSVRSRCRGSGMTRTASSPAPVHRQLLPRRGRVHPGVHILWGESPAERLPEIAAFAGWMHDWSAQPNGWNSNLNVLGDLNLDGIGDRIRGHWPEHRD